MSMDHIIYFVSSIVCLYEGNNVEPYLSHRVHLGHTLIYINSEVLTNVIGNSNRCLYRKELRVNVRSWSSFLCGKT